MTVPSVLHVPTQAGLAAEQQLLADVCDGNGVGGVLFWQATDQALVMPRRLSREAAFEAGCAAAAATGWPVLLRETGGEPVPQSSATLNVALVYAAPCNDNDRNRIETAYLRLCEPLSDTVRALGGQASLGEVPGAFCDGRYNVNLDGRKWAGTAQRWRQANGRAVVLAHAALLMDNDRQAMVAAVNAFNQACGLPQRCDPHAHVAFHERFPGIDVVLPLGAAYANLLSQLHPNGCRRPPWSCP